MSEDKEKKNYFIAEKLFPVVRDLFEHPPKSLKEIMNDCLVVLDTNVLLLPYTVGGKSLEEIRSTFNKLIKQERLFLPSQVVREFANNRPNKLSELYQQVSNYKSKIYKIDTPKYPLFESLKEYTKALEIQEEINKLISKYQKEIGSLLDYVKDLDWNDQISQLYRSIFTEQQITQLNATQESCLKEFLERCENNIPPGIRDKSKVDGGIGDFLIWKTILQLGENKKKDIIFVSGDEKNDWFHQSMGKPLYPRFELIDEFKRVSKGATFKILSFSKLLSLYGADEEVVQEVKTIEIEQATNFTIFERMKEAFLGDPVVSSIIRVTFITNGKTAASKFHKHVKVKFDSYFAETSIMSLLSKGEDGFMFRFNLRFPETETPDIEKIYEMISEIANGSSGKAISDIKLRPLRKIYDDNKKGQQLSLFKDNLE